MKTLITTTIAAIAFFTAAFSQQIPWNDKNIKMTFDKASFIFEGEVIKSEAYLIGTRMVCTSNIVRVDKIFKGGDSIKLGTIDVVTEGGLVNEPTTGDFGLVVIEGGRITGKLYGKGIFFCYKSTYSPSTLQADNEIRVSPSVAGGQGGNGAYYLFDKKFNTKEELYQHLSTYPNITIPQDTTNEK